ncbi:DUF397 domain-containing protein [Actinophytocola xanthii]|uniref:DUF397 domain-containing protein n=1 Tax=Actinophytocola xanthii TaxID=1912961 RepID=UPI0009FA8A5B|nr:DUF397 domain-containing protein [Actinophytocola xanthii]
MWRSSTFSAADGNCVEIRGDLAAVRDSKHREVVMPVSRAALVSLVRSVRTRDEVDHVA